VAHGVRNSKRRGPRRQMYICRKFWFEHLFFENHDKLNIKNSDYRQQSLDRGPSKAHEKVWPCGEPTTPQHSDDDKTNRDAHSRQRKCWATHMIPSSRSSRQLTLTHARAHHRPCGSWAWSVGGVSSQPPRQTWLDAGRRRPNTCATSTKAQRWVQRLVQPGPAPLHRPPPMIFYFNLFNLKF
jgi:hypothetical protein